jgi:hypothetical protein
MFVDDAVLQIATTAATTVHELFLRKHFLLG